MRMCRFKVLITKVDTGVAKYLKFSYPGRHSAMINTPGSPDTQDHLSIAIFRILKSVAKFALQYGMSAGATGEILRRAFIEAAEEVLKENNAKVTTVRVCAMTGLYRKEVRRIEALPPLESTPTNSRYSKTARVVAAWRSDPDFLTKTGKPAALKPEGENSFETLVRKYSGDMTPVAMKHELNRLGILTVSPRKWLKLHPDAFKASTESDALEILGTDVSDLVKTIRHNHNIDANVDKKLFQRKVCYINIPEKHVADFFEYAANESQKMLERLDRWLSRKDYDFQGEAPKGARVGVGVYHIKDAPRVSDPGFLKQKTEQQPEV